MAAEELLRYGNWSGPGWTAGMPASVFIGEGHARKVTDEDRAVDGIDRYDNYVAKAHDLNELAAEDALRLTLAELDLVSNATTTVAGRPAYQQRLKFGGGGADMKRFVSLNFYMVKLKGKAHTNADIDKLGQAFVRYFMHVAYSNLQFAVDCILNDVSRWRNVDQGSFRMAFQLLAAPHWFMGEAHRLEVRCLRATLDSGVTPLPAAELEAYLAGNFVSPGMPFFAVVHGEEHIPTLTPAALLTAEREDLVDAFAALLAKRNLVGRKRAAREIGEAAPEGFDEVRGLIAFLEG